MRVLSQRDLEGTGSRSRATPEEVTKSLVSITNIVGSDNGYNVAPEEDSYGNRANTILPDFYGDWLQPYGDEEDWIREAGRGDYFDECLKLEKECKELQFTRGTLEVFGYLSEHGVGYALQNARSEIAINKYSKSASNLSDEKLAEKVDSEYVELARISGPVSEGFRPSAERMEIEQAKAKLEVLEKEMNKRGISHHSANKSSATATPEIKGMNSLSDAITLLDKKVNRERKKMGLPPLNLDNARD